MRGSRAIRETVPHTGDRSDKLQFSARCGARAKVLAAVGHAQSSRINQRARRTLRAANTRAIAIARAEFLPRDLAERADVAVQTAKLFGPTRAARQRERVGVLSQARGAEEGNYG